MKRWGRKGGKFALPRKESLAPSVGLGLLRRGVSKKRGTPAQVGKNRSAGSRPSGGSSRVKRGRWGSAQEQLLSFLEEEADGASTRGKAEGGIE